jgi:CII-binding regulator of phage lambda lysogenization HflD
LTQLQSVWETDDFNSSVVSTTHKSASLISVGASYYSYLTNMEKQLREERDARKALENEINKLKKKNDELIENLLKPN